MRVHPDADRPPQIIVLVPEATGRIHVVFDLGGGCERASAQEAAETARTVGE
jgi:hypothetical protein